MVKQLHGLSPFKYLRSMDLVTYAHFVDTERDLATTMQHNLTLVHWPLPHLPAIYDRRRAEVTATNLSFGAEGYLDNMALTDRTLGELRRAMEGAGTWDTTTILITADHWWRQSHRYDGRTDHRIPFLLKLAGHNEGIEYSKPFNSILIHDLCLDILRGRLVVPAKVKSWIDRHRSYGESPVA